MVVDGTGRGVRKADVAEVPSTVSRVEMYTFIVLKRLISINER